MTVEQMKKRLAETYPDGECQVTDLTGTENHYEVFVVSSAFNGLSRIRAHQHVMAAFALELKTGEVHALSIRTQIKIES